MEFLHGLDVVVRPPPFVPVFLVLRKAHKAYGGGPVSALVNRKLLEYGRGVRMFSLYGATEFGAPMKAPWARSATQALGRPDSEWEYCQVSDAATVRWEDQGDGTFELVVLVSPRLVLWNEYVKGC